VIRTMSCRVVDVLTWHESSQVYFARDLIYCNTVKAPHICRCSYSSQQLIEKRNCKRACIHHLVLLVSTCFGFLAAFSSTPLTPNRPLSTASTFSRLTPCKLSMTMAWYNKSAASDAVRSSPAYQGRMYMFKHQHLPIIVLRKKECALFANPQQSHAFEDTNNPALINYERTFAIFPCLTQLPRFFPDFLAKKLWVVQQPSGPARFCPRGSFTFSFFSSLLNRAL
jgi:hypothetical protein